jgi:hypothetical protein
MNAPHRPVLARGAEIRRLRWAATVVELRLRLGRALSVLPAALVAALTLAAATLSVHRSLPQLLSARHAATILGGAAVLALAAVVLAAARRLPPHAGAIALDRHHGLSGRLGAALAFASIAPRGRTPLMELAIDDACAHAAHLEPRAASPLRMPHGLVAAGIAAAAVVATARLSVPRSPLPPPRPPEIQAAFAVTLSPDDLELFHGAVAPHGDVPGLEPAARFEGLVEDLADRRLDRAAAFRVMLSIEQDLGRSDGGPPEVARRREALREHLRDLRELIRQQGHAGRDHGARVRAFARRARGGAARGLAEGDGEGDLADAPEPTDEGDVPPGNPRPRDDRPRPPGASAGAGPDPRGDEPPAVPRESPATGPADQGMGTGHDESRADRPGDLPETTRDVQLRGGDSRRGASKREVILAAAERGFRGAGYQEVFAQYRTVVEDHLGRDRIPDGYRFYVHRYFQLIRSRD